MTIFSVQAYLFESAHSCAEGYTLFNLINNKTLSTISFVFQTLKSCHSESFLLRIFAKWSPAQAFCACFHVTYTTLKLPTKNLPVDWDQQGFYRVNVARVKGFSLAYLHVIHFETSRFNIKSFARVLLLFFRSFPVHLENYPECILRTIGWARGLWEDTSYQYLLGNFKDGERSWLSMLKLYL